MWRSPKGSVNEKGRGRFVEHPSAVARNALEDVPYAHLGDPSLTPEASSQARIADHPCTATGLIHNGQSDTVRSSKSAYISAICECTRTG
jgi:hypothetical protein